MSIETPEQHEQLVAALLDADRWPDGGGDRRRIDTHISTVVLAGDLAYKIKKPLDLGFLDFLSLESRHAACSEEIRLNSRLAADIYQAVCAITGSIDAPRIDGDGPLLDWAVRMRRFDPDAILSNRLERLDRPLIIELAGTVAAFHVAAARCPADEHYATPPVVYAPMTQNFAQIRQYAGDVAAPALEALERWTSDAYRHCEPLLEQRRRNGHVRECHGDLHLGNVALIDDRPVVFDAIEFNADFRWIDTVNDLAFLFMDLQHRGRRDLAYLLLDRYLQESGDYGGLPLLRFYAVYRALVRAKIAAIRRGQSLPADELAATNAELGAYVDLAQKLAEPHRGAVVITHGVSGSGKSFVAQALTDFLPAVRLRSDVERKRLLGVEAREDASAKGAYSAELTARTYRRLAELTETVVQAGYVAVADATFLKRSQRAAFRDLAAGLEVPFVILDCDAPVDVLRERILARRNAADNVSDADLAVLDGQLASREPLDEDERDVRLAIRPDRPLQRDVLRGLLA